MRPVPPGTRGTFSMTVRPEDLASQFKDATLPPVLSTPVMIKAMENAALEALKPYFEPGESAVGTRVNIEHLAATPVGRGVTAHAEVVSHEGRVVEFRVNAEDEDGIAIGRGTHVRTVIDLARFRARLRAAVRPPPEA